MISLILAIIIVSFRYFIVLSCLTTQYWNGSDLENNLKMVKLKQNNNAEKLPNDLMEVFTQKPNVFFY